MSQLVCGVSIWRTWVPPERRVVRARTAWTTPYGKHPWKQKQTRAGWKAPWPVGHSPELGSCWVSAQARGLLLCPLGQRSPGDRCSRKQLCERAGGGLWAWVQVCTSNMLFWSRVCGDVGLAGWQVTPGVVKFSNDSNHDRKLDEMGRGDSHFSQKQNC